MREISSKRKKSEEDHIALAKLEWRAGLNLNEDNRLIIPGSHLDATLKAGLTRKRGSVTKKMADASLFSDDALLDIGEEYKDPYDLMTDAHIFAAQVRLNGKIRIVRTRPIFRKWSAEIVVNFIEENVPRSRLVEAIQHCSTGEGLGDWRPRYGRYSVEIL
jgi:hypothetical protein